jgi:hypothetical protein
LRCRRNPVGAFRAVVGDGAHLDREQVDRLRPRGDLLQFGQAGGHTIAFVGLGHANPRMLQACHRGPGARGMVLHDRDRGHGGPERRPVVGLYRGQHAGQVCPLEVGGGSRGGLRLPLCPAHQPSQCVRGQGEQPLRGRAAAHRDCHQGDQQRPDPQPGEHQQPVVAVQRGQFRHPDQHQQRQLGTG